MAKFTDQQRKAMFAKLNNISKNARMSEPLRKTVHATSTALKENNLPLATELTSVKSLIGGKMNLSPSQYPFREDDDFNQKNLGVNVYGSLDEMHHDLALRTDTIPSGMSIFSSQGITSRTPQQNKNPENPQVTIIQKEFRRIRDEAKNG